MSNLANGNWLEIISLSLSLYAILCLLSKLHSFCDRLSVKNIRIRRRHHQKFYLNVFYLHLRCDLKRLVTSFLTTHKLAVSTTY